MSRRLHKIGSVIDGWKKQRGGHWYCEISGRRGWRARAVFDGVWGIRVESGQGFADPLIPVAVLQDLLAQIELLEEAV